MPKHRDPYFDKPGLSFHQLRDFQKSPRYYYRKHIQKVIKDDERPAYALGRAVHCLTLEGKAAFDTRFVCVPPEYLTPTGMVSTSKEAKAWKEAQTCDILSPSDYTLVQTMAERVKSHSIAAGMLANGKPEVECYTTRSGMEVKGKADWISEHDAYGKTVIDLKTCADLDSFAEDAKEYGYDMQMAWYTDLFGCTGHYLIAVEKSEPHRVGVYYFGADRMALAAAKCMRLMSEYVVCKLADTWQDRHISIQEIA